MKNAKSILLVEDNAINQKVALAFLKKFGCTVDLAGNGEIAVQLYSEHYKTYDLIFMDVMMPVMNGLDATLRIRSFEKENNLKPTKIIAMTAKALNEDLKKCLDAGMNDYLIKPVHIHELKRTLELED